MRNGILCKKPRLIAETRIRKKNIMNKNDRYEIADGVYVDVYNLHADANEDEGSLQAKKDQFDQLKAFIDEYSADRAVIIADCPERRPLMVITFLSMFSPS